MAVDVWPGHPPGYAHGGRPNHTAARRCGCQRVTFVGERGMIKSPQMEALVRAGFHDITALTKPQVERLLKDQILQLALFTAQGCEVRHERRRYSVRRHPLRAEEVGRRAERQAAQHGAVGCQEKRVSCRHPRAQAAVALRERRTKLARLKIDPWLTGAAEGRTLGLRVDVEAQREAAKLDGCYVLTTICLGPWQGPRSSMSSIRT